MNGPGRRADREPGYVLHRRPFRETSLLVELFTRRLGRVALVARGARRARRADAALLEPLRRILVSWTARGELGTLTGVDADGDAAPARPVAGRLIYGLYANELLMAFLARDDPQEALFGRYEALLRELAGPADPDGAMRLFERDLLALAGYALELAAEADTGREIDPAALYRYELDHGPVRIASRSGALVITGHTLQALARGRIEGADRLAEAQRLLSAALRHYRGGRAPRSPAIIERLRGARAAAGGTDEHEGGR